MDQTLQQEIIEFLSEYKKHQINPEWWEQCKNHCKEITINHSKRLANKTRNKITVLEYKLSKYQQLQTDLPGAFKEEILNLEQQLKLLLTKENEGSKIRSRIQQIDSSEKTTTFFLRKEEKNIMKKTYAILNSKWKTIYRTKRNIRTMQTILRIPPFIETSKQKSNERISLHNRTHNS